MSWTRLKAWTLPDDVTIKDIKRVFQNEKKNGGGPIKELIIHSSGNECYAIITFEDSDAVKNILQRGRKVPILETYVHIESFGDDEYNHLTEKVLKIRPDLSCSELSMKSLTEPETGNSNCSSLEYKTAQKFLNKKETPIDVLACIPLPDTEFDNNTLADLESSKKVKEKGSVENTEAKHDKTPLESQTVHESESAEFHKIKHDKTEQKCFKRTETNIDEMLISESENNNTTEADGNEIWSRTVKAKIIDIKKTKLYYELYFEDLGFGSYVSEKMFLDGLHKLLYVTFTDKSEAQKLCHMPHDSKNCNISNIEMTTPADFDIYDDRLFLYGNFDASNDDLKEMVNEKTGIDVKEIILGDEQHAAVVVLDKTIHFDVTSLTWDLTDLNGIKLITAPVYKEKCVLVSGLSEDITETVLARYIKSKKHSHGGPVQSVVFLCDGQALVMFVNEEDLVNFILKDTHHLEGCHLDVSIAHSCLRKSCLKKWITTDLKFLNLTPEPQSRKSLNQIHDSLTKDLPSRKTTKALGSESRTTITDASNYEPRKIADGLDSELKKRTDGSDSESRKRTDGLDSESRKRTDGLDSELKKRTDGSDSESRKRTDGLDSESRKRTDGLDSELKKRTDGSDSESRKRTDGLDPKSRKKKDSLDSGSRKRTDIIASETTIVTQTNEIDLPKETMESENLPIKNVVNLKEEEFLLIKKGRFFTEIKSKCKQLKVSLKIRDKKAVLKGLDKEAVSNIELTILKKCKSDIASITLNDLTQDQKWFLKHENYREKLNWLLPYGCLLFLDGEVNLFYIKTDDVSSLKSLVKSQLSVKRKQINSECFAALQSPKGEFYLKSIEESESANDRVACILLDEERTSLLIMGPDNEINNISKSVDTFLSQNTLISEKIDFPEGKKFYLSRFMQTEKKQILTEAGVKLESSQDCFTIIGLEEKVKALCEKLLQFRKNIVDQSLTLKFYGIQEFLQNQEIKISCHEIEHKNKCIITMMKEPIHSVSENSFKESGGRSRPEVKKEENISIAATKCGQIEVVVVKGEISNQKTDVIVITVDKSLDLSKGRISKIVLEKAGEEIQKELKSKQRSDLLSGDVVETSGGDLSCAHILYGRLSRFKDQYESRSTLRSLVSNILRKAKTIGAKSISIPALGTGGLGYPPDFTASVTMDAIKTFALTNYQSSLKLINLVVYSSDTDVVKAFSTTVSPPGQYPSTSLQVKQIESKETSKKDASRSIQYGNVKLIIQPGNITQIQDCDAIVNSINIDMDLYKSGKVCKALLDVCKRELQAECREKRTEMEQYGVVVTSAPNLKCKNILHINQEIVNQNLKDGIIKVLMEADKHKFRSLALPALGTGFPKADFKEVKKTLLGAIEKYSQNKTGSITLIKLVIFDQKILNIFLDEDEKAALDDRNKGASSKGDDKQWSKEASFLLYSDNMENIRAAKNDLENLCENYYVRTSFHKVANIHLLSKSQVELSVQFGLQNGVEISINETSKEIQMNGFHSDVVKVCQSQFEKLIDGAKPKGPSFQWQFKQYASWKNFEPMLNHELEREFKKKTTSKSFVITDAGGEKYEIDFDKMTQSTLPSTSYSSKHTYEIQRVDKNY